MKNSKPGRCSLRTLVLMNWQGFFFQPFLIDEAITALEGENGAGKTTAMIAAFVALIPDRNLLRFRNVSESGESGGEDGLYGRLGDDGVSYSVMDYRLSGGKRLLAGVHIKRKLKPKLEITPFIITDLSPELPLEEILLEQVGEKERIPMLPDLQQQIARLGGRLKRYESVGQYGAALFDLGVMPLRMEAHSERKRFNRMLQTSMYGGLSGSIQKGLRDYLLTEDPNLRSHVARMRDNLEACRVTKSEIDSASEKFNGINSVYEEGAGMVKAAFHGARLQAKENRDKTDEERDIFKRTLSELERLGRNRDSLATREKELDESLILWKKEKVEAANMVETCEKAQKLALRIKKEIPLLKIAEEEKKDRAEKLDNAEKKLKLEEKRRYLLQEEIEAISHQLSNAQKAWEEVSRKAGLYRQAQRSMEDAQAALKEKEVTAGTASALLAECREEWDRALKEKGKADLALETVTTRRLRFDEGMACLVKVKGEPVKPEKAGEEARRVDMEFRSMEHRIAEAEDLPRELKNTEKRAKDQRGLRLKIQELESKGVCIQKEKELQYLFHEKTVEQERVQKEHDLCAEEQSSYQSEIGRLEQGIPRLEKESGEWSRAREWANQLEKEFDCRIDTQESLAALKSHLQDSSQKIGRELERVREERKGKLKEVEELEFKGGRFHDSLIVLAEKVEGTLAAELYDNTPEEEAADTEARLGPLQSAIITDNISQATETINGEPERPDHVWLLKAGEEPESPASRPLSDSWLVPMGKAWRLSKKPDHPVTGRAAREKEVRRLRNEGEEALGSFQTLSQKLRKIDGGKGEVEELYKEWRWIGASDPVVELKKQTRRLEELKTEFGRRERSQEERQNSLQGLREWIRLLHPLLPHGRLLDEEDWEIRAGELRKEIKEIESFKEKLRCFIAQIKGVRESMMDLEKPPPSQESLEELRLEQRRWERVLHYWKESRNLLEDLERNLPHFRYRDQLEILEKKRSALSALEEKQKLLFKDLQEAKERVSEKKEQEKNAKEGFHKTDAHFLVLSERIKGWNEDLERLGEDGSGENLEEARKLLVIAEASLNETEEKKRKVHDELITVQANWKNTDEHRERTRNEYKEKLKTLRPIWRNWILLRKESREKAVLDRFMTPSEKERFEAMGSVNAFQYAREKRGALQKSLPAMEGGSDLRDEVEKILSTREREGGQGGLYLAAWILILRFLERSIPRDIAQSDDPETALKQIQEHLERLSERLDDQEMQLFQKADHVANSILTRIRREAHQIQKLNKSLALVRFGSIQGVQVKLERVEAMHRLLQSMRIQRDLFQQDFSLEETLERLYQQVGGGEVRGDQLLDYRQYIHLNIEIRRMGREKWETARSGALSTGESIGIGAAVLMVILEAWEKQALLLRRRKDTGSFRFLFLDEAARLSQNSLMTLAEICDKMEMQLLVAAPEADRARRGITHHLTRRRNESGVEEVVVRGRRLMEEDGDGVE